MARFYVGLDVHSKWSVYVVQDESGQVVGRGQVPTSRDGLRELRQAHGLPTGTQVGLETGTTAFYVARQLWELALEPVVIDAHEVRLKAHRPRQKSDRRDAFEICEGLRRGIYRSIVHVPPEDVTALRETLSRRRHFVRAQTSEVNAVKRLLRGAGLAHRSRSLIVESGWVKLGTALAGEAGLPRLVEHHHAAWRCAGEQVALLEGALAEQSQTFMPDFGRLQTAPGVGPIVSLTAIAVFSDVRRFPSAKHAASYTGLVPSTDQSADRDVHGHLTRRGSAELRAMLCEAAQHASHRNSPLNPYFAKLCATGGYKKAVVGVAHRLCRILYAMLRDQTDFDVRKLGIEVGPFERKVVRPYRLKRTRVA